jgi:D-lactate dehydrogenase
MAVMRIPAYSPYAVAEYAGKFSSEIPHEYSPVGLMLALNRKIHKAYNRVRELDFSLDGLMGFDMRGLCCSKTSIHFLAGKTVGVIGTGAIGAVVTKILHGFECNLLGYDVVQNPELTQKYNLQYVSLDEIFAKSGVLTFCRI